MIDQAQRLLCIAALEQVDQGGLVQLLVFQHGVLHYSGAAPSLRIA